MNGNKKPAITRGELSFLIAIGIGIAVGLLVKKMKFGLMLGLILGLIIVFMNGLRKRG